MVTKTLQPLIKRSAESLAVDALRAHVLSGAVPPGHRLTEAALAQRLQVSRGPVRTALHQLTLEGLVSQIPYTGWQVASLTPHDAWELYTLRSSLEALAARLAAERHGTEENAALRRAMAQLEDACKTSNGAAISDADYALHKSIIRLSKHRRLLDQYQRIEQQTRLAIRSSNALIADPGEIIEQHRPIVEAILAGRGAQAARLSEKHNVGEGEKLVSFLETSSSIARSVA